MKTVVFCNHNNYRYDNPILGMGIGPILDEITMSDIVMYKSSPPIQSPD